MKKVMHFALNVFTLMELVAMEMMFTAASVSCMYHMTLGENVGTQLIWLMVTSFAMTLTALVIRDVWEDVTEEYDNFGEDVVEEEIEA